MRNNQSFWLRDYKYISSYRKVKIDVTDKSSAGKNRVELNHMSKKGSIIEKFILRRNKLFQVYHKHGFDFSLHMIRNWKINKRWKNGFIGELAFYDKYRDKLKLAPIEVAKADFHGFERKKETFYQVTTSLAYKDPNDFLEFVKRGRNYTIVLVDPKNFDIEFMPLRLPLCKECGSFAHYIFYLNPPTSKMARYSDTSDWQDIIQYCNNCEAEPIEIETFHYFIHSPIAEADEMAAEQMHPETRRPGWRHDRYLRSVGEHLAKFSKGLSQRILSGVAENEYIITDHHGGGYWAGRLLWKHPLMKDLGKYIDVHMGPWLGIE